MGTQASAVAREVGARLKWPVFDRELLELIAQELGTRVNQVEAIDEKPMNGLSESIEWFAGVPFVSEVSYVRNTVKTVLALGTYGESVIVGRGAAHFLPAETTLRVRLVAPLEQRIATIGRSLGMSREDAKRKVETVDRERTDFVRHHFFKDAGDPRNYDLVLNAASFSTVQCADIIVEASRQHQANVRAKQL
jgi:hypothetical protein